MTAGGRRRFRTMRGRRCRSGWMAATPPGVDPAPAWAPAGHLRGASAPRMECSAPHPKAGCRWSSPDLTRVPALARPIGHLATPLTACSGPAHRGALFPDPGLKPSGSVSLMRRRMRKRRRQWGGHERLRWTARRRRLVVVYLKEGWRGPTFLLLNPASVLPPPPPPPLPRHHHHHHHKTQRFCSWVCTSCAAGDPAAEGRGVEEAPDEGLARSADGPPSLLGAAGPAVWWLQVRPQQAVPDPPWSDPLAGADLGPAARFSVGSD